ncbi:LysR family transcriptional regulator [Clostridium felsineum]|uniref:LysR family transcriptional regulator n=1 Tax=Clostridium felsineum TaxID=36839 RepID=UPI00214D631A|nr:LysR family transcriptional regulator [Clostridium felsineum]MCR3761417.1 LysR family transcriptional regulator [Clostridium felsineum]
MNKRELNYFLKVYENKSIKRAAEALFISSQGLSKTIKNLEAELSVQLFKRTSHGVEPTIHAHNLNRRAKIIIEEFENIKNDMLLDKKVNTTVLRVLSTFNMLKYLTLDFIQDFYTQFPNIRLDIVEYPEEPIEIMLKDEQVEIAFLSSPIDTNNFEAKFCTTHKNCLIINKNNPLSKKNHITFEDLRNIPIAVNGREFKTYKTSVNLWLKNGVTPNVLLETSEETLIHEVAKRNLGIGISLDFLAHGDKNDHIVIRPVPDKSCTKDVYIVKKSGKKLSTEAKCFEKFTLEWLKNNRSLIFK